MNSTVDISLIQQTYAKMTNDELIHLLTKEASDLTLETLEIAREEIKKRNLDPNILKAVDAQSKNYTTSEIDEYCKLIQKLDCPVCNSSAEKLNATITGEVLSFLIVTQHKKKMKVACPSCLDKANNSALLKTATLGWWGIPWGIIKSIQYIGLNVKSKKTNHAEVPNNFLRQLVLSNIGLLEMYKTNKEKLQELISK